MYVSNLQPSHQCLIRHSVILALNIPFLVLGPYFSDTNFGTVSYKIIWWISSLWNSKWSYIRGEVDFSTFNIRAFIWSQGVLTEINHWLFRNWQAHRSFNLKIYPRSASPWFSVQYKQLLGKFLRQLRKPNRWWYWGAIRRRWYSENLSWWRCVYSSCSASSLVRTSQSTGSQLFCFILCCVTILKIYVYMVYRIRVQDSLGLPSRPMCCLGLTESVVVKCCVIIITMFFTDETYPCYQDFFPLSAERSKSWQDCCWFRQGSDPHPVALSSSIAYAQFRFSIAEELTRKSGRRR